MRPPGMLPRLSERMGRILGVQRLPEAPLVERCVEALRRSVDLTSQLVVEHRQDADISVLDGAINARRHVLSALRELGGAP